jgi:hypothetical protein
VFREGFERSEEGAGAVGETHGNGHFAGVGSGRWGFRGGEEQDEAGEIFGVVLDVGGEDDAGVVFGGAAAGYSCGSFFAAGQGLADAASGVFCGDALEVRMRGEETFALCQGHGMGGYRADGIERGAWAADEVMLDREDGFGGYGEGAFQKEIVNADDRACERVFDGG